MPNESADCIFCQIGAGTTPADVVYESDATLFFRDLNPQAPTHILGVPKKHITSVAAVTIDDEAVIGQLIREAAEVARKVGVAESGFRLLTNTGADAGQVVDHLHFHVMGGEKLGPIRC